MKRDLNSLSVVALGNLFPIILTEFNPEWVRKFSREKELILNSCDAGEIVSIHHIGSTAIPGIISKPTIDILIEIADETDLPRLVGKLKGTGYYPIPKPENPPPHIMFAKGYSETGYTGQTFHLHLRYKGDWDELIFRDYLIENTEVAVQYSELKRRLSVIYRNDREKYTDNKTDFIKEITKRAREKLSNKTYF
jgi:GrpB-like predicted nucleotidyltransferase (UPF0157 family)